MGSQSIEGDTQKLEETIGKLENQLTQPDYQLTLRALVGDALLRSPLVRVSKWIFIGLLVLGVVVQGGHYIFRRPDQVGFGPSRGSRRQGPSIP